MITALVLVTTLTQGHLIGPGGLIGPAQPVLTVGQEGDAKRKPVHGVFPWEYGQGIEELLNAKARTGLTELRQRNIGLASGAVVCGALGSGIMALGFYLTPLFVNVSHPGPGGLVGPILISSLGLTIGLVAIPLAIFMPGNYEIDTLVQSHNNSLGADAKKIIMLEEMVKDPTRPGQIIR
jgi:hypothetical protein